MIVPIMKSNPQSVERMREQASESGFLSAARPGPYRMKQVAPVVAAKKTGERKLSIKRGGN